MIKIHKVTLQNWKGIKHVGVKYSINDSYQPFVIMPHADLFDKQDNTDLKQAVLDYLAN